MTDQRLTDDPELDALMDAIPLSPPNSIDSVVLEALLSSYGASPPQQTTPSCNVTSGQIATPIRAKIDFSECTSTLFVLQPAGEQLKAVSVTPRKPDSSLLSEIIKLQAMATDRVLRSKSKPARELFPPARKSDPAPTPGMPPKRAKKD